MNRFILRVFYFLLPLLLVAYPVDFFISKNLAKSKSHASGETGVWNDIYNSNVNSEIVIYGSSRAWVHISPKIIQDKIKTKVYNLGLDGHHFGLQYNRHKALLKNNIKPKTIIMSLDIFTLVRQNDLYNKQQFLPYLLWNKECIDQVSSFEGYIIYDYSIPLVRYFNEAASLVEAFNSFFEFTSTPSRQLGYKGMERTWNNDFVKARVNFDYYQIIIDPSTLALFERFIIECLSENIKLILVYSPEYIEGQKFVKNRNQIMAKYFKISQKYQLPFFNYSNDSISYKKEYFYNTQHLNRKGSELFTRKLISDLW